MRGGQIYLSGNEAHALLVRLDDLVQIEPEAVGLAEIRDKLRKMLRLPTNTQGDNDG